MKRIIALLVFIFFSVMLIMASNAYIMKKMSDWMYTSRSWFGSDKYRYGDLYGLSYISSFRREDFVLSNEQLGTSDSLPRDIQLDAIGDSYMYSFIAKNANSFARVKNYQFITWSDQNGLQYPKKDTHKKILLLEIVERNAWQFLFIDHLKKNFANGQNEKPFEIKRPIEIESNLAFLLFDHNFFTRIKEAKASLLLSWFGKVPGDVLLSKDGQYLYLKETMMGPHEGNSFFPISNESFAAFEKRLNEINDYFTTKGYDEVWLFIAPNPVRVLGTEDQEPNQLFNYLSQSKTLKIKFLNILPVFAKDPERYYLRSDSHWNDNGASAFKNLVNQELKKRKP